MSPVSQKPPRAATGHSEARSKEKLRAFHEEGAIGKAYDWRLVQRLWPYVKPHGQYVALSLATLLIMAGVNLARPLLMGDVVRSAMEGDARRLMRDGFGLVADFGTAHVVNIANFYRGNESWYLSGTNVIDERANADFRYYSTGSPFEYEMIRFLVVHKRLLEDEGLHKHKPDRAPDPATPAGE